jgi:hypothetical protein
MRLATHINGIYEHQLVFNVNRFIKRYLKINDILRIMKRPQKQHKTLKFKAEKCKRN